MRSKTKVDKMFEDFMAQYWSKYDVNGDNKLDKSEFRVFITDMYMDILREQNGGVEVDKALLEVKISKDFDEIFTDFDKDKNGVITKDEMYYFVLELLGVEVQNIDFKKMKTELEGKLKTQEEEKVEEAKVEDAKVEETKAE